MTDILQPDILLYAIKERFIVHDWLQSVQNEVPI